MRPIFEKIVCMGEDEFDCPLLEKKEIIAIVIPTIDIVESVSILHECTPTCTLYFHYREGEY